MKLADLRFDDKVAFIEMRNSKKLNCLSSEFCKDMIDAIKSASANESCCAIVVHAEKDAKVFSAGHDIRELPHGQADPLSYAVPMEHLLRAVQNAPIPVIALVTGTVWGGACDFCVTCDMIVADENSTFAITPAKLGIPYNASGISRFVSAVGINRAREMFFTAAPITAREAFNLGLANHIAPADELMEVLNTRILNPIRKNSILAISCIKRQFRALAAGSTSLAPEFFEAIQTLRTRVYESSDYIEGINSFLEKRSPKFTGKASDVNSEMK